MPFIAPLQNDDNGRRREMDQQLSYLPEDNVNELFMTTTATTIAFDTAWRLLQEEEDDDVVEGENPFQDSLDVTKKLSVPFLYQQQYLYFAH